MHLLDTGLAAALADLTADDWLTERPRMSHLLESFAVQQLMAQAAWADPTGPDLLPLADKRMLAAPPSALWER